MTWAAACPGSPTWLLRCNAAVCLPSATAQSAIAPSSKVRFMLDRAVEERHLQLADAHVLRALELIVRTQGLVEEARQRGSNVEPALRSLSAMQDLLSTFTAHRDFLVRTISDIDAGRL